MHIFKGIFFVEMQAERRALGPKNSQKTTCKDQDGILMKIFNDKHWPQQEDVACNSKGILYKALRSVNGCSVKINI